MLSKFFPRHTVIGGLSYKEWPGWLVGSTKMFTVSGLWVNRHPNPQLHTATQAPKHGIIEQPRPVVPRSDGHNNLGWSSAQGSCSLSERSRVRFPHRWFAFHYYTLHSVCTVAEGLRENVQDNKGRGRQDGMQMMRLQPLNWVPYVDAMSSRFTVSDVVQ